MIPVCKYHGVRLVSKKTKSGAERLSCKTCNKFLFKHQIIYLFEQYYEILQKLNSMDEILGQIWEIAFYHPKFPKLENGLPKYGLGELFVSLHECQRNILDWKDGVVPKGFGNLPSRGYDSRIKEQLKREKNE